MKLGVAVNNLGPSQLAFRLITQANDLVSERTDLDIIAFYERVAPPCVMLNIATMPMVESFSYDGAVVATDLSTAQQLAGAAAPASKFFLVWDLEWTRMPQKDFRSLRSIYGDERLRLLARSEDHAKAISDAWNRSADVVGDLDLERILELV